MSKQKWPEEIAALLAEILTDAYGDEGQLWALRQAFSDHVALPADAVVVGEVVRVTRIDYDGSTRRGLTARCRSRDGDEYDVSAADVGFAAGSKARYVEAYRKWLGLAPAPRAQVPTTDRSPGDDGGPAELDLDLPVELVVLAPKAQTARCRILGTTDEVTLRSRDAWKMIPGEIVAVQIRKQWSYAGHPYLSGQVKGQRRDASALGLLPLRLVNEGTWDPSRHHWGDEDEPMAPWEQRIRARGPRPSFEMEQVLPGADPRDWDTDPIIEANHLHMAGDRPAARKILLGMLTADLRCLDAHAHLGNFAFRDSPGEATRHYQVGVDVAQLSLGDGFDGLLPWGCVDNRPFLRCLHGLGLCLWRLDRDDEAVAAFERTLWLNPTDNLGARFHVRDIRAGERWPEPSERATAR